MIELEKTYLAKKLPDNIKNSEFKEVVDNYIPRGSEHPKLRLRKNGNIFELTKKEPVNHGDASHQEEQTIILSKAEYGALNKIEGKRVRKLRFYYDYGGRVAEIDIFQDALIGLVVIDFEFATMEDKDGFQMPDFCLADVTQEDFIAGGMLCGKSYEDIANELNRYGYNKLSLQ